MQRCWFHSSVTWCLVFCLALTNTLLSAVVMCRHADGGTAVEWTCHRTVEGECAAHCESQADEDDAPEPCPEPCQDTRIADEHQFTKSRAIGVSDLPLLALPAVAPLPDVTDWCERPYACRAPAGPARPPDIVAHIRSTILRV